MNLLAKYLFLDLSYGRESKLLCKKIVAFFALLSKTQETGVRKLGVTQELLSLVTSLAHYLKLLIRIGLQGSLRLERETNVPDGLHYFLDSLGNLDSLSSHETAASLTKDVEGLADPLSDCCESCKEPIDDACCAAGEHRWHTKPSHIHCAGCRRDLASNLDDALWYEQEKRACCRNCAAQWNVSFDSLQKISRVTKLQQYVFLLRVALARLLAVLRAGGTLPHTSGKQSKNQ